MSSVYGAHALVHVMRNCDSPQPPKRGQLCVVAGCVALSVHGAHGLVHVVRRASSALLLSFPRRGGRDWHQTMRQLAIVVLVRCNNKQTTWISTAAAL
jgi:hypothetical protein